MTLYYRIVMHPTPSLRESLQRLRTDQASKSMLSEDDVMQLLDANPVATLQGAGKSQISKRSTTSVSAVRWTIGGACLAAGVAAVMLWPNSADYDNQSQPIAESLANAPQSQNAFSGSQPIESNLEGNGQSLARSRDVALSLTTPMSAPQPAVLLTLSVSELQALNLHLVGPSLTYAEDGVRITVLTNGISARGSQNARSDVAPRHITMYRKGIFAQWFDDRSAPVAVNDMIGITVSLRDTSKPNFIDATVILWYAPTDAFINALPEQHQSNIRVSLQSTASTTSTPNQPVERRTRSASISATTIAPNPVQGSTAKLILHVTDACTTEIYIIDMMGQRSMDFVQNHAIAVGTHEILLSGLDALTSGMYVVVIDIPASNERLFHRLLIER